MISAPNKSIKALIGDTVSLRWHYNSGDLKNDLCEVVFGIWKSPGFLGNKVGICQLEWFCLNMVITYVLRGLGRKFDILYCSI